MKANRLLKTGIALMALLAGVFGQISLHAADGGAAKTDQPQVQILQRQTSAGEIQIVRIAIDSHRYAPVAHRNRSTGHIDLQLVSRSGGVVLIGRRLVRVQHDDGAQTLFEEISVRVPHPRFSMGWDVKALERELERLGVKVKPPAGVPAPRPAPPVTGGA